MRCSNKPMYQQASTIARSACSLRAASLVEDSLSRFLKVSELTGYTAPAVPCPVRRELGAGGGGTFASAAIRSTPCCRGDGSISSTTWLMANNDKASKQVLTPLEDPPCHVIAGETKYFFGHVRSTLGINRSQARIHTSRSLLSQCGAHVQNCATCRVQAICSVSLISLRILGQAVVYLLAGSDEEMM